MDDYVVVMQSFLIKDNGMIEYGNSMLWKSVEDMESYLKDVSDGKGDRPFEHRWNYIVAEKVPYGPYIQSEVIGWWEGHLIQGDAEYRWEVEKLPKSPIQDAEHMFNFTITG